MSSIRAIAVPIIAVAMSGCLWADCPQDLGGIREHEQLTTTILSRRASAQTTSPCDTLDDLSPGTVITWTASLQGPGDGCDDRVSLDVADVTSGTYANGEIHLPNGCAGFWSLGLLVTNGPTKFTDPPDPAAPSWVLTRQFRVTGDPTLCWPSGPAPSSCSDSFIARNDPR